MFNNITFKTLIYVIFAIALSAGLAIKLTPYSHAAETAQDAFQSGLSYFEQQKFDRAIDAFNSALDAGDERSVVYYNLAVSEYKLGRLASAEKHFKLAAEDNSYYDLSAYNIGLIDTRRRRYSTAKKWFSKVRKSNSVALYARARRMIDRINKEPERKPVRTASILDELRGLVSISAGRDDNVNRASDNSPSNVADSFTSIYASTALPISADKKFGINGSFYAINYSDLNSDDFNILRAGVFYKTRMQSWRTKSSLSLASSDLGHSGFQKTTRLEIAAKRKLTADSRIRFVYQYDDIDSSNVTLDYLQGWRQRLRAIYKIRAGDLALQARYRLELNDRADLPTQSFSPTRHTIRGIASYPLTERLRIKADIAFRDSDYPDIGTNAGRTEERLQTAIKLRYKLNKRWFAEASYRHSENDSTNALFDYNRNDLYLNTTYVY